MELLGVGAMEALLVLVVALIVVGPHRFPGIARQGGQWYRVARRYATEVSKDVRGAMEELQTEIEEEGEDLRAIRDLGEEMDADLRTSKLDIEEVDDATMRPADETGPTDSSSTSPNVLSAQQLMDAARERETTSNSTLNDGEPTR